MASTAQKTAQPKRRQLRGLDYVAERLDCSVDSVDRYIKAGKIPVVRLPSGRRRVDEEDLDRLIEAWRAEGR